MEWDHAAAEKDLVPTKQGSQLWNRILRLQNAITHPQDRLDRILAMAGYFFPQGNILAE